MKLEPVLTHNNQINADASLAGAGYYGRYV